MDRQEAKHVLKQINELHFELEHMKTMEEELKQKLSLLRREDFPVGLVRADFLEQCGRYVFIDDLGGR